MFLTRYAASVKVVLFVRACAKSAGNSRRLVGRSVSHL
eukprot:gene769-16143_t